MSNILIIKHGSLGDIAQASGAIQDISNFHKDDKVYLLTSKPYIDLFKKNPYVEDIILDKRLSRFNLVYLFNLMRKLKKYCFQMLVILFGRLLKTRCQKINPRMNLIKIPF